MVDYIKIRKGLNIPMEGIPEPFIKKSIVSDIVALKPSDYKGVIPKLLVREGDSVKAGSPVFADKARPEIHFSSPVSGTIQEIVRGDKRKLLEIRIKADPKIDYLKFDIPKAELLTADDVRVTLLESGLWASIKQRPYGIIANPSDSPKCIYISGFNTAPLAADLDLTMRDEISNIQVAINALSRLTSGKIYVGLFAVTHTSSPFQKLKNVEFKVFDGPHPTGNVGIQIHRVSPINKGEVVWTVDMHLLASIGKLFSKGIYDVSRMIAISGSRAKTPSYIRTISGMCFNTISDMVLAEDNDSLHEGCDIRYISGNVLTGENVGKNGFLGFYDDLITLITEGSYYEMFGWAKPFRSKKFSFSSTYFSWFNPKKQYNLDSNINGGERAFVMTGKYEKVLPMNILPVYLLKAILAEDIDKMEQLGIYEVIEEDFALCEYICSSKIEIQSIISRGIDMMIKEMS